MTAAFDTNDNHEFETSTSGVFGGARKEHERYAATLTGAHDGDTVYATINLSTVFGLQTHRRLRIRGLLCAELHEPGGSGALIFTEYWCRMYPNCQVTLYGWSHDRIVADVVNQDGVSLKDAVIAAGFGKGSDPKKGST